MANASYKHTDRKIDVQTDRQKEWTEWQRKQTDKHINRQTPTTITSRKKGDWVLLYCAAHDVPLAKLLSVSFTTILCNFCGWLAKCAAILQHET
jgi:hypothetical protein